MMLFLGYRIYTVTNATDEVEGQIVEPPSGIYNKEPEKPPLPTIKIENVDLGLIIRRPIFLWEAPGRRGGSDESGNVEDQKLELIRIIEKASGKHLAQLTTGGKKTLVKENDSFESYTLLSIDIEEQTCLIYSENSNSNITISVKK